MNYSFVDELQPKAMWPEAVANPTPYLPRIGEICSLPDVLVGDKRWTTRALGNSYKAKADSTSPSSHVLNSLETRASCPAKNPFRKEDIPLPVGTAILGSFLGDRAEWVGRWQSVFPLGRRCTVRGSLNPGA